MTKPPLNILYSMNSAFSLQENGQLSLASWPLWLVFGPFLHSVLPFGTTESIPVRKQNQKMASCLAKRMPIQTPLSPFGLSVAWFPTQQTWTPESGVRESTHPSFPMHWLCDLRQVTQPLRPSASPFLNEVCGDGPARWGTRHVLAPSDTGRR